MIDSNFNWNAAAFFERLTGLNRFAKDNAYRFSRVSSLGGFHDALGSMTSTQAFVAVSDTSQGGLDIENTPHTRRVKTVFLAKRHAVDDMKARERCMDNMRELFRQFMSVLLQEKHGSKKTISTSTPGFHSLRLTAISSPAVPALSSILPSIHILTSHSILTNG